MIKMTKKILALVMSMLMIFSCMAVSASAEGETETTPVSITISAPKCEFDQETNICSYGMDLFQRRGGLWCRSFEEHQEYAYTRQQLEQYLKDAGFTSIEVFADRRMEAPSEQEQRIYIKARKGKIK